jgi:4-methyl-5(b-hydroxyethyl)-thiazole monophosphate biosynthesis
MAEALVVLAPGAEEIEFCTVPDILVRAGVRVTVASTAAVPVVEGSRGLPLAAHTILDRLPATDWDLVYLPGGVGSARTCREDPRIQAVIAARLAAGRLLACVCAAPTALIPGGHARGRRLTSFPAVRGELESAGAVWITQPVVQDGALVTGQSAGTTLALALRLAALLAGADAARTVAAQIIAPAESLAAALADPLP